MNSTNWEEQMKEFHHGMLLIKQIRANCITSDDPVKYIYENADTELGFGYLQDCIEDCAWTINRNLKHSRRPNFNSVFDKLTARWAHYCNEWLYMYPGKRDNTILARVVRNKEEFASGLDVIKMVDHKVFSMVDEEKHIFEIVQYMRLDIYHSTFSDYLHDCFKDCASHILQGKPISMAFEELIDMWVDYCNSYTEGFGEYVIEYEPTTLEKFQEKVWHPIKPIKNKGLEDDDAFFQSILA